MPARKAVGDAASPLAHGHPPEPNGHNGLREPLLGRAPLPVRLGACGLPRGWGVGGGSGTRLTLQEKKETQCWDSLQSFSRKASLSGTFVGGPWSEPPGHVNEHLGC